MSVTLRSATTTEGRRMAGARALWMANGMKREQMGKPIIAIANSFTQMVPGHTHLHEIGQQVKVFADYGDNQRKEYAGTIIWISSRSEFTPKTILTDDERADLVYAVKVAIKNDGFVKIGMYGEVKLSEK